MPRSQTIVQSIRIQPEMRESLCKVAEFTGVNRNTLIVQAIERLLQEHPEVTKA